MGEITFILGGARSGKSQYALRLAKETGKSILFIATATAFDKEMCQRIKLHRKNRPSHWKTFAEPRKLASLVKKIPEKTDLIIIDCLTLFISNLLLDGKSGDYIEARVNSMLKTIKKSAFNSLLVANEVGLGIVPDNPLARRFRDLAGRINQLVAKVADEVYFVVSGIPLKIKGVKA